MCPYYLVTTFSDHRWTPGLHQISQPYSGPTCTGEYSTQCCKHFEVLGLKLTLEDHILSPRTLVGKSGWWASSPDSLLFSANFAFLLLTTAILKLRLQPTKGQVKNLNVLKCVMPGLVGGERGGKNWQSDNFLRMVYSARKLYF